MNDHPKKEKKHRTRIPQKAKVRAQLQRDIGSQCPHCESLDVGVFEIHHIDANPKNNDYLNLHLVCPTCHSKIEKCGISEDEVRAAKRNPALLRGIIEVAAVVVDSNKCGWQPIVGANYAFHFVDGCKSRFPILGFSCINHTKHIVLLTAVHLRTEYLDSGLGGLLEPQVLRSTCTYQFSITGSESDGGKRDLLSEQIAVPAEHPFRFDVELIEIIANRIYPPEGRLVLYFTLTFNSTIDVKVPTIYLNCDSQHVGPRRLVIIE